ncbi:hypothetical protein D9M69_710360 [compost metagenome]
MTMGGAAGTARAEFSPGNSGMAGVPMAGEPPSWIGTLLNMPAGLSVSQWPPAWTVRVTPASMITCWLALWWSCSPACSRWLPARRMC